MAIYITTGIPEDALPVMNPSPTLEALNFISIVRIASCIEGMEIWRFGLGWILSTPITSICQYMLLLECSYGVPEVEQIL